MTTALNLKKHIFFVMLYISAIHKDKKIYCITNLKQINVNLFTKNNNN